MSGENKGVAVLLGDATEIRSGVAEALTLARDLAGADVFAVALSEPSTAALETLSEYGVARVVLARIPPETVHVPTAVGQAVAAVIAAHTPAAVILTSSFGNKEAAADAAWRTGSGLLVDVTGVEQHEGRIRGSKRTFAGTWQVVCASRTPTTVLTLSPNAVVATPAALPERPEVLDLPTSVEIPGALSITERHMHADRDGRPALAEAAIVVAGGRGTLGEFGPVEELADELGAAIGTTRDCVDEGWIGHDAQIGQTGITIAPRLYIGAGISGAPHHHGGMQASGYIVAVNTDPDAPLAEIADVVVVGDLHDVLPAAADALREHRASSA